MDLIDVDSWKLISRPPLPDLTKISMGPIEPWMKEFVKERHSQEDWEAFFFYVQAGRFKRFLLRIMGMPSREKNKLS